MDGMRSIPGFEGYFARRDGKIFSRLDGISYRELKQVTSPNGYKKVSLRLGSMTLQRLVHEIILTVFIGPRPKGMVACHGRYGKNRNSVENLSWGTPARNNYDDKLRDGKLRWGEKSHLAKLAARDVISIRYIADHKKLPQHDIARLFNTTKMNVSAIRTRRTWRLL